MQVGNWNISDIPESWNVHCVNNLKLHSSVKDENYITETGHTLTMLEQHTIKVDTFSNESTNPGVKLKMAF